MNSPGLVRGRQQRQELVAQRAVGPACVGHELADASQQVFAAPRQTAGRSCLPRSSYGWASRERAIEPGPRERPIVVDGPHGDVRAPARFRPPTTRQRNGAPRRLPFGDARPPVDRAPRRLRRGRHPVPLPAHRARPADTRIAPAPPRRSALRCRAMSTRTRRIICAETPKKWPAILPARLVPAEQPKTHFVDERRRLQRDARTFADEIPERHPVQFVVHERHQLRKGGVVAIAPRAQQAGEIRAADRASAPCGRVLRPSV